MQMQKKGAELRDFGKIIAWSHKCQATKGFVVPHASLTVSTDMLDRFLKAHWDLQNLMYFWMCWCILFFLCILSQEKFRVRVK
jgi:hypothetical protein